MLTSADEVNDRRLEVINKCNQTKINQGFSLITVKKVCL